MIASDFEESGYIIQKQIFDSRKIHELNKTISQLLSDIASVDKTSDADWRMRFSEDWKFHKSVSTGEYYPYRLKKPAQRYPAFNDIRTNQHVLHILRKLIGENIYCFRNKVHLKPPERGEGYDWHQDWASNPCTNDSVVHVGVALDDMNSENGSLSFIPRSHKGKLYDHHLDGRFVAKTVVEPEHLENAVTIDMSVGDICIFHTRLLHSSAPNNSLKYRRLYLLEYGSGDAWPLLGINDWDHFSESFVSGEPNSTPRFDGSPVKLPFPGLTGVLQKV